MNKQALLRNLLQGMLEEHGNTQIPASVVEEAVENERFLLHAPGAPNNPSATDYLLERIDPLQVVVV